MEEWPGESVGRSTIRANEELAKKLRRQAEIAADTVKEAEDVQPLEEDGTEESGIKREG